MLKVLFLTPWYPSEKDAMSGLFVQKHVEAVRAQDVDVRVIHSQENMDTIRQYRALVDQGWRPDLVQLNVIQKQGLLALALWEKEHIPYIIVEHWSGYLPENGSFLKMSAWKQRIYRRIARKAGMILTVSERLAQAMRDCGIRNAQWGQIHNVVDDFFFEQITNHKSQITNHKSQITNHKSQITNHKTLLHVSCFDERAKNVKGLLRAAKMLSEKRQDWRLILVGTGVDYEEVRAYADTLAIPDGLLRWTGELTPREVAQEMQRADALVLSSRYETYGVVLAEAVAVGLPILSTPVGIAEEVADLIVPQEIAQHKAGTFAEFLETILFRVESRKSKVESERFTSEAVGKTLKEAYDSCLHRDI